MLSAPVKLLFKCSLVIQNYGLLINFMSIFQTLNQAKLNRTVVIYLKFLNTFFSVNSISTQVQQQKKQHVNTNSYIPFPKAIFYRYFQI